MKSIDISHHTDFRPQPVQIRVGSEDIEVRSLNCAIDLICSLRHDRLGNYAEMLLVQLEAAREPRTAGESLDRVPHLVDCVRARCRNRAGGLNA